MGSFKVFPFDNGVVCCRDLGGRATFTWLEHFDEVEWFKASRVEQATLPASTTPEDIVHSLLEYEDRESYLGSLEDDDEWSEWSVKSKDSTVSVCHRRKVVHSMQMLSPVEKVVHSLAEESKLLVGVLTQDKIATIFQVDKLSDREFSHATLRQVPAAASITCSNLLGFGYDQILVFHTFREEKESVWAVDVLTCFIDSVDSFREDTCSFTEESCTSCEARRRVEGEEESLEERDRKAMVMEALASRVGDFKKAIAAQRDTVQRKEQLVDVLRVNYFEWFHETKYKPTTEQDHLLWKSSLVHFGNDNNNHCNEKETHPSRLHQVTNSVEEIGERFGIDVEECLFVPGQRLVGVVVSVPESAYPVRIVLHSHETEVATYQTWNGSVDSTLTKEKNKDKEEKKKCFVLGRLSSFQKASAGSVAALTIAVCVYDSQGRPVLPFKQVLLDGTRGVVSLDAFWDVVATYIAAPLSVTGVMTSAETDLRVLCESMGSILRDVRLQRKERSAFEESLGGPQLAIDILHSTEKFAMFHATAWSGVDLSWLALILKERFPIDVKVKLVPGPQEGWLHVVQGLSKTLEEELNVLQPEEDCDAIWNKLLEKQRESDMLFAALAPAVTLFDSE